jgi:hypothetical protein
MPDKHGPVGLTTFTSTCLLQEILLLGNSVTGQARLDKVN